MADIAAALGKPLMPWQQHVADVALEVDPATGRLVYRNVTLTVPRQSGKTTLLLALILCRALAMGDGQQIVYTAQTGKDARKKWMDEWLPALTKSPFRRSFRSRRATGSEALLFNNGSIQSLIATTKESGHGSTLDLVILDEAFSQIDDRLEQALSPAQITRPEPQFWIVSTAGTPDQSPFLHQKVETGRAMAEAGVTSSLAYFEWSAHEDMEPSDRATWWSCMPALGITQPEAAVVAEFEKLDINEFERAYLNRWKSGSSSPVIPLEKWAACLDHHSTMLDPVCFAFDVTPDRSHSAIAACGARPDGMAHVEALVKDCRPGTDWVPRRLLELRDTHQPRMIVCDPRGPAGSLLPELEKLGIVEEKDHADNPKSGSLVLVDAQEHAQACGMLFDRTMEERLRHLDQPMLVAALDGAKQRPLGDAWAWSRRSSSVNIAPLVAVTLSHWAHCQASEGPSVYESRGLLVLS